MTHKLIFIEVPEDAKDIRVQQWISGKNNLNYATETDYGIDIDLPDTTYFRLGYIPKIELLGTVTLTECTFDVEPYTDVVKYEGNIHQYKELCENQFRNKIEKELGKSFTNPLGEEWPSMPNAYLESGKEQEEVWTKIKEWQAAERNKLKKVVVLKTSK